MNQTQLEERARAQNPDLYYLAVEKLGTQQNLARYLTTNSEKFKSVNGWAMFLSRTMWYTCAFTMTKPRLTQQQDFYNLVKELLDAN